MVADTDFRSVHDCSAVHTKVDSAAQACANQSPEGITVAAPRKCAKTARRPAAPADHYLRSLEEATRGLLALNVSVLERMEKRIGLAPLRALQSLERLGPSLVTELGSDLDLLPSTASRLSDRLAEVGYITRQVSPTNRRATVLELTDAGRAVLAELVALRLHDFGEVVNRMNEADRTALVQGTQAFTTAHRELATATRDETAYRDTSATK